MGRSRRVLLVNPVPLYSENRAAGAVRLQPGLVSIFSFLQARGVSVEVLDLHLEVGAPQSVTEAPATIAECTERVLARDFDLMAVSCNSSFHYLGALDLAVAVRAADPRVLIVVGGCHASAVPDDFCGPGSPFDIVVRGEGELELLELAYAGSGRPERTEVRSRRPLPLDTAFADFAGYPYWKPRPHSISFPLSRGCPFSCAFCAGAERSSWRAYPPRVARSLASAMIAERPQVVAFSDACFGLRPAWRREFMAELRSLQSSTVFHWETRVDTLSTNAVREFGKLDLQLDVGLESASPRMIEAMGKAKDGHVYLARARRLLQALGRRQVPTQVCLVLNHPGEDDDSLNETMVFARELADRASELCAFPTAHAFMHLPGTPIAEQRHKWEQTTGVRIGHPEWWRERGKHGELADDVSTAVCRKTVRDAVRECQAIRGRAVMGMPVGARLTWRAVRGALRLSEATIIALRQR